MKQNRLLSHYSCPSPRAEVLAATGNRGVGPLVSLATIVPYIWEARRDLWVRGQRTS